MSELRIIHNPRCSKSRQTLQLLQDRGLEPTIIEYLKTPLDKQDLTEIIGMLGIDSPRQMMRTKEAEYKEQNLSEESLSAEHLIDAMVATPKLIERPIVINNGKARIGRPPESVTEIL